MKICLKHWEFYSFLCGDLNGKEINRTGKIRDLFKKIKDTRRIFHAKVGTIKNRNGIDLTEAEIFNKRCQEYMEELYKIS